MLLRNKAVLVSGKFFSGLHARFCGTFTKWSNLECHTRRECLALLKLELDR